MKGRDYIFTSLQSWDISIGANVKEIASRISKDNRVLFINSPLDIRTYLGKGGKPEDTFRREVVRSRKHLLRKVNPNLWLLDFPFTVSPVQFLPDGILFDAVNYLNNKKIYTYAQRIITSLGFKNPILFNDNDIYRSFYAKRFLKPQTTVLYIRDNLVNAYWKRHEPRLSPILCKEADLVLTNSEYYRDMLLPHNAKTYYIGQGVDLKKYDIRMDFPVPPELAAIPRPIIGYMGFITSLRLDATLLYEIMKARPQYSFVLVGKEDELFQEHPMHQLPNVFFLGEKPYNEVASYVKAFDVCINPQLINEITRGNYPLKIDEYLALGKATVATRTDFMGIFKDTVWTCIGTQEYLQAIDQALTQNTPEEIQKRTSMAHSHSWEHCIQNIYSHLT